MSAHSTGVRNRNDYIVVTFVALSSLAGGCLSPVVKNDPIAERDLHAGYRFDVLKPGPGNTDDVFVCLCFSGGGTRAAALSFGVLQGLRDARIPASADRPERRLLDEVDIISSVSGGSFTAMSYGLDRDVVFEGRFEREFLKQNIQNRLLFMIFRPANLLLLPYVMLDRIDLAADYYDKAVFERRTYRDLIDRGDRPYLVINAGEIKNLVVIVVDANTHAPEPIEHLPSAPGFFLMAEKTGTTSMYNYSEAMTEVLRNELFEGPLQLRIMDERCRDSIRRQCPDAAPPEPPAALKVRTYLVEVSLHQIADPKVRRRFLSMPTSLFLSSDDVDALIDMGRTLVAHSPEFQRLFADLKTP